MGQEECFTHLRQEALQESYVSDTEWQKGLWQKMGSERQQEPHGTGLCKDYKLWISSCVKWKSTGRSQRRAARSCSKILDLACRLACDVEEKNYGRPERMLLLTHWQYLGIIYGQTCWQGTGQQPCWRRKMTGFGIFYEGKCDKIC